MGCLPAGFKNVNPGNKRQMEDRLEVERLTVAAGAEEIPALTETQIYNATKKAIDLFDKNYLLFRKQNKKKGLIVPSIAVSAEGLHPDTGKNTGCSIEKEMEQASLWSSSGMANLVRLHKGTSCYENPTVEEQKRLGPPGKQAACNESRESAASLSSLPWDDCPRGHQAFTAYSWVWFSARQPTIQSWISFLLLGNNQRNGICFQGCSLSKTAAILQASQEVDQSKEGGEEQIQQSHHIVL